LTEQIGEKVVKLFVYLKLVKRLVATVLVNWCPSLHTCRHHTDAWHQIWHHTFIRCLHLRCDYTQQEAQLQEIAGDADV